MVGGRQPGRQDLYVDVTGVQADYLVPAQGGGERVVGQGDLLDRQLGGGAGPGPHRDGIELGPGVRADLLVMLLRLAGEHQFLKGPDGVGGVAAHDAVLAERRTPQARQARRDPVQVEGVELALGLADGGVDGPVRQQGGAPVRRHGDVGAPGCGRRLSLLGQRSQFLGIELDGSLRRYPDARRRTLDEPHHGGELRRVVRLGGVTGIGDGASEGVGVARVPECVGVPAIGAQQPTVCDERVGGRRVDPEPVPHDVVVATVGTQSRGDDLGEHRIRP